MTAKLIQYWDIIPGGSSGFDDFFKDQYLPQIDQSKEMKIVGSWVLAAGGGQRFIVESVSDSLQALKSVICASAYQDLKHQLWRYVHNYHSKLLLPNGVVDPALNGFKEGFKLTQHFNINAGDTYGFDTFLQNEQVPILSKYKLELVGCWKAAVGATPYVIVESRVRNLTGIGEMIAGKDYQRMISGLLDIASNYGCKILAPSGHLSSLL